MVAGGRGVTPARTRVVGYVRVSTEQQEQHGFSLEAQQEKLRAYATLYDLELVEVLVDSDSAKTGTLDRPALARALAMLEKGEAAGLLVAKLDRLTRSVRDLGELLDRGFAAGEWSLLSVAEQVDTRSAAGRLVLNVLVSVSQWERETIGERTSDVMRHMAAEGLYTGGAPPYGSQLGADGQLHDHAEEQETIAEAARLRASGLSLERVGDELARAGRLSRAGKRFEATQISRMLRRRVQRAS